MALAADTDDWRAGQKASPHKMSVLLRSYANGNEATLQESARASAA